MGIIIGVVVLVLVGAGIAFAMKGKGGGESAGSDRSDRSTTAPRTTAAPQATATAPVPTTATAPAADAPVADSSAPKVADTFSQTAEALSSGGYDTDPVPFTKPSASLPRLGLEPSSNVAPAAAPVGEPTPAPAEPVAAEEPASWLPEQDETADESADDTIDATVAADSTDEHEDEHEDERFDRFSSPGQRMKADDELLTRPLYEMAGGAGASTDEPEPVAEIEPEIELELEPEPEPESEPELIAEAETELVPEPVAELEPEPEPVVEIEPEPVIAAAPPNADPVDHVLNALINRAKERQVGIAQVAAELVEQADLEDKEVDEVLADLLGVASAEGTDGADRPELTLFSTEVPQRPGQLTDFARLGNSDKKRALIRVLCLLVALQEEHKLDDREAAVEESESRSWPLARAVWPTKPQQRDEDGDLPTRSDKPSLTSSR